MDILSHVLWANLVFNETPQRNWAVFFSIFPDIVSFGNLFVKNFIKKTLDFNNPPLSTFPSYVFKLYKITHSLVVVSLIYIALYFLGLGWWSVAILGWGLHIILDIFTHQSGYFATPILWPLSDFHFSGTNWATRRFMILNYLVIGSIYIIFFSHIKF